MKQAINIPIKSSKLNGIYKPYAGVKPHITLVYPFEYSDQKKLKEHIKKSISKIKPFKISFEDLKKSKREYYLYLLVKKGKPIIVNLQRKLNSGLLDFPKKINVFEWPPHITLRIFKNKKEINDYIQKIKDKRIKFEFNVNKIQLVGLKGNKIIKRIKFNLK